MSEYIEPPPDAEAVSGMSPREAIAANEQLRSIAVESRHPFVSSTHPRHDQWAAYATGLTERILADEREAQQAQEGAAVDALEQGDLAASDAIRVEAEQEVAALKALGFEGDLDHVEPWQLPLLKAQRANAEGRVRDAAALLTKEMGSLGASPESVEMLRRYAEMAGADEELRAEVFDVVLRRVHEAARQRHGRPSFDSLAPIEDQIRQLRQTPGFADGKMYRADRARFDRITAALDDLYRSQYPE